MKNRHPYRLTKTDIRIPTHKIKWVKPPYGNKSKGKDKSKDKGLDATENFNRLFVNNLNAFIQFSDDSKSADIVAVEDWEEGDYVDS